MRVSFLLCCCLAFVGALPAQSLLNGSFESYAGGCQYNIANATFNASMPNTVGFGVASQLDIIQTSCGYGAAQQGNWFVAMAVDITNTQNDAFSMRLSSPLTAGSGYSLSWYDRGWSPYNTNLLEVGLSTSNNTFGSLLYTTPLPTINTWVQRTVNFNAPNNGQFVTARVIVGSYGWTHVDNFVLGIAMPVRALSIYGEALPDGRDALHWEMEGGESLRSLMVERMNAAGDWEVVDSIPVKEAASEAWVSAVHWAPAPHVYRLGMEDMDGLVRHSEALIVQQEAASSHSDPLEVFPNPAVDEVRIVCADPLGTSPTGRLELLDMQGRLLRSQPADVLNAMDLSGLGNGLYWVRWVCGTGSWSKMVVREGE